MQWKRGLALAATAAVLVGGAAGFRFLAPENYGLPAIEIVDPGSSGRRIEEAGLFGNYFPAGGPGPHPAVLVLGGSEGGLGTASQTTAVILQQEGFAVFQLAYFGVPGTPDTLEEIPLEMFDRALDWLGRQPAVDPARLAVVGASKGAEAALLIASRRPDLRAVVAAMPTNVVWNGVDWSNGGQSRRSSWTANGAPLAAMPFAAWNAAEGVISVYRSVEDPALALEAARAAIPIEQAEAPVLLVCGEAETMWPACPMARAIEARSQAGAGPPITTLAYEDAGHFLFGPPIAPDSPFYDRLAGYGGTIEGNAAARIDSWPRVVSFLKEATAAPDQLSRL